MFTLITSVFQRLDLTRAFVRSLEVHPPPEPWSMTWIDDGSTDGSREWLRSLPVHRHRVLLRETPCGFAANNNLAAREAPEGATLLLLNNDLVLRENWFAPLVEPLAKEPGLGFVGNVHLQPATGRIDHAGVLFTLVGLPDHVGRGRRPPMRGPGAYHRAVCAACCAIRRDVFLDAGGFDEGYRNGYEDIDLCLRLGEQGRRHWVTHASMVEHHVSSSPGRKDREVPNVRRFLARWGEQTTRWGGRDWPAAYLAQHLRQPLKVNGPKALDALLRLARLRRGDSAWAARRRAEWMGEPTAT